MRVMKVSSSRPIVPNARLATAYSRPGEAAAPAARAISDSASVLSIPDAELTPRVKARSGVLWKRSGRFAESLNKAVGGLRISNNAPIRMR